MRLPKLLSKYISMQYLQPIRDTNYPRTWHPTSLSSLIFLINCLKDQKLILNQDGIQMLHLGTPVGKLLCPLYHLLSNKDNIYDDGLMSQLTFNADIDNEVYLNHCCPNPNLVDDSTPPPAELLRHYTKLFDTLIASRLKISRDKTLSALRRHGELSTFNLLMSQQQTSCLI